MSDTGKGPGVAGIVYNNSETFIFNPLTLGFIYAPVYPTTLNSANQTIDLIKFPIGEYFFLEYNITLWNPNSNVDSGEVVNGILRHGYITFDTQGGNQNGSDSNNMDFPTYVENNELPFSGVDVSLTTDVSSFTTSGQSFQADVANTQLFVQSDGTDFTLKFTNYKAGQKLKGFITLI